MQTISIITEKMVFGGDCIAKLSGKTVFVPYTLPQEELSVEITEDTKDYCRAEIKEVLTPSPHRMSPICPLYKICGGCNMQHIDPLYQIELKKDVFASSFKREGIDIAPKDIKTITSKATGYRARFQFHDGGLMGKKSNNVISLDYCPCATEEINKWLKETPQKERPKGRVHVFASNKITSIPKGYDKIVVSNAIPEAKKVESDIKNKKKAKKRFEGAIYDIENTCTVELCKTPITFNVNGFFQSNLDMLEKTIPLIVDNISGMHVLDMYAGVGTFSTFLSKKFNAIMFWANRRGLG